LDLSPYNCVQEIAPKGRHYPWRVMVTCILLNQTHGRQVRPMIDRFWELVPEPDRLCNMPVELARELHDLLKPLGFVNKRMYALIRNACDYLKGVPLRDCYGIGKYGADAIALFVHGRTDIHPTDTWLLPYLEWRRNGGPPLQWATEEIV
jgi:methyl-CpG-binding domain protein 4